MNLNQPSVRCGACCLAWLAVLCTACGVTEHPHPTPIVDTSNDFGPSTPASPAVPSPADNGTPGPDDGLGSGETPVDGTGSGQVPGGSSLNPGAEPGGTEPSGGEPTGSEPTGSESGGDGPGPTDPGSSEPGGSDPVGTEPGNTETPIRGPVEESLSGITVPLGGIDVPKEHAIAFIHIGHSNMAGRANSPEESRPFHFEEIHPRAWKYRPGSPPEPALEPTASTTRNAGPGTALVKEAAMASGTKYYFISLGFGVTSAYCSQFLPSGLHYDQLMAAPLAIKDRVTFGAIFIYLGITERHGTEADRTGFPNCINELTTAIRNDVGAPDIPLLLNDYEVESTGGFAVGGSVANAIMPQIALVPTTVANSALVSADDLGMQDNHHFNLDGQRVWAQRAIATMQQNGWFPWTDP